MCGRYLLTLDRQMIVGQLELPFDDAADLPDDLADLLRPRYNIAPSTDCAVVTRGDGERQLARASWGFVPRFLARSRAGRNPGAPRGRPDASAEKRGTPGPSRADGSSPSAAPRPINARSESAQTKPMFKHALARQRCLVPASGFYEWQRPPGGSAGQTSKQPYCIWCEDSPLMTFAGIWDVARLEAAESNTRDGNSQLHGESSFADESASASADRPAMTFCILTTRANDTMAPIHDRMPVIVSPDQRQRYLDPGTEPADLADIFEPYPDAPMRTRPVSTYVNRPQNQGPRCLEEPPSTLF